MDDNYNKPAIIITGPTAVGKTFLSVKLAEMINGEIISADSMQVYKGMNIGTAKIKPSEMHGIKHHMIDVIDPRDEFNVMIFKNMVEECIKKIYSAGKIPIIAGGTGFYIQAVLKNINFTDYDPEYETITNELNFFMEKNGINALYEQLKEKDPEYAATLHPNNTKRVIKALAHYLMTNEKYSEYNKREAMKKSPYNYSYFVLNMDRKELYKKINERVDNMISDGLVTEVEQLVKNGLTRNHVSMQGLGYKEVIDYLEGISSYDEMIYLIKRETRHFAKRQLTWFKREPDVIMLDKDKYNDNELLEIINSILIKKGIIK